MPSRTRLFGLLLLAGGAVLLAACGGGYGHGHGYEEVYLLGEVEVDNLTDLVPPENDLVYFALAPALTYDFTGNLLSQPLWPGEIEYVGDFYEDYYDGEGEFFLDPVLVEWFDEFVGAGQVTTFEAY